MMATELERERDALERSAADIAAGHERIERQHALIAEMRAKGLGVAEGERLLALLGETLAQWEQHHEMIAARIAYLEGKQGATPAAPVSREPGRVA